MADPTTISEFLISVGFSISDAQRVKLESALKAAGELAEKLDAQLKRATDDVNRLGQSLSDRLAEAAKRAADALRNLRDQSGGAGQQTDGLGAKIRQLLGSLAELDRAGTKAVRDFGKGLLDLAAGPMNKVLEAGRKLAQQHQVTRKDLIEVGKVAVATGTAFFEAMRQVGKQYQELHYIAQRTGATVGGLQALAAGFERVGGAGSGAYQAIDRMTSLFRTQPGREGQLMQIAAPYLDAVGKNIQGIDKRSQQYFATLRGMANMSAPLAAQFGQIFFGWSDAETQRHIKNIEKEEGAVKRELETQRRAALDMDKIAEQADELTDSFNTLARDFGKVFLQAFSEVAPLLTGILHILDQIVQAILWFNAHVPFAATIESALVLAGALTAVLTAFELMVGFGPTLAAFLRVAGFGFAVLRGSLGLLTGGLGLLARGLAYTIPLLLRFGASLLIGMGPIGWIVLAITAAVAAIIYFREEILGAFEAVGSGLKAIYDHTIGPVLNAMGSAIMYIVDAYKALFGEASKSPPTPNLPQVPKGAPGGAWAGAGQQGAPGGAWAGAGQQQAPGGAWATAPQQQRQQPGGAWGAPPGVPQHARGGLVTDDGLIYAHAGEVTLPKALTDGLIRLTQRRDADGMADSNRTGQKLGDWLSGANAPKVVIENIDEFVREFLEAAERARQRAAGKKGGEAEETGPAAEGAAEGGRGGGQGAAGTAAGAGQAAGGREGGGGGEPRTVGGRMGRAAGTVAGTAAGAVEQAAGAALEQGTTEGGGAESDGPRASGKTNVGAGGKLSDQAIGVFKERGWSDAAIQAVMAHGLGEGGFGESWKQSGVVGPGGQREQSFGHWQFNMKGGEGPAYMAWAKQHNLDPKDTRSQALYVAETMEKRSPGFSKSKDFNTAFGAFEKDFERSKGGVAGKLAYARQQGTIGQAEQMVRGYQPGATGTQEAAPAGGGAAPSGASAIPGAGGVIEMQQKVAKVRKQALQQELRDQLEYAGLKTGLQAEVHSGGQDESGPNRVGSHRHDKGGAADLDLRDVKTGKLLDMTKEADRARMQEYMTHAVRAGATGIGAAEGYMGTSRMHIGGGSEAAWGEGGSSANTPGWVRQALHEGQQGRITAKQRQAEVAKLRQEQVLAQQKAAEKTALASPQSAAPAEPQNLEQGGLPGAARGGIIPDNLLKGIFPMIAHRGEMVLPEMLSKGLQGLIGGLSNMLGGHGGLGALGGMLGNIGGMMGRGGLGGMLGNLDRIGGALGGTRLGGDMISNFTQGPTSNITVNQTNNHTFTGTPGEMMNRLRGFNDMQTGTLVRNFRLAAI